MTQSRVRCDWLALWILWSVWCSASGWILSLFSHLDRAGYLIAIPIFTAAVIATRRWWTAKSSRPLFLLRYSTFRRFPPRLWLTLLALSLIGGLCFHADNYDYLTYRFPRLLYWWWHHHWYWIETTNDRRNFSATGMEWLMAPLFVLFRSDRPFFVINIVSFLFLPGLVLSVFRNFGVSGRIAWWWMWVLPLGICYAVQAGGMGNDMFTAVYLLAAFHYAAAARRGSSTALALSILSIALLTGGKASNVPLVLPWLTVMAIDRPFAWNKKTLAIVACTCVVAALVSILPVLLANKHFSGDFGGDPTNGHKVKLNNPIAGVLGNSLMLLIANFWPPIWPHDFFWTIPAAGWLDTLRRSYPRLLLGSSGLQLEESCSLGLGVSLFWIVSILRGVQARMAGIGFQAPRRTWLIAGAMAISWLGYMSTLGSEAVPRLVAPYYVLTVGLTLALVPLDGSAARSRIWRAFGYFAMLTGIAVVALTPGRPLLSSRLLTEAQSIFHLPSSDIDRLIQNRALRASRMDNMRSLRESIPASESKVGLIGGGDDPNLSLWIPFGSREAVELDPRRMMPKDVLALDIHYVAVSDTFLEQKCSISLDDLLRKWNAAIIQQEELTFKTQRDREKWYLIRLR